MRSSFLPHPTLFAAASLCTIISGGVASDIAQAEAPVGFVFDNYSETVSCSKATITCKGEVGDSAPEVGVPVDYSFSNYANQFFCRGMSISCDGQVTGRNEAEPAPSPPGATPSGVFGYDSKGNGYTYEQEIAGEVNGILYFPNRARPKMIIYPGDTRSVIYPDCAGMGAVDMRTFDACGRGTESLAYGVTYVVRLLLNAAEGLPHTRVEVLPTLGGNNEHGWWTAWISKEPGLAFKDDPNYPQCTASGPEISFYLNERFSTSCLIPSDLIKAGKKRIAYLNFTPTGAGAEDCGTGKRRCRTMTNAW